MAPVSKFTGLDLLLREVDIDSPVSTPETPNMSNHYSATRQNSISPEIAKALVYSAV